MRILYVTVGFMYPLTSGTLRHYYFLRELGTRHDITVVSLVDPGFDPAAVDAVRPLVNEVLVFGGDDLPTRAVRARRKIAGFATWASPGAQMMREAISAAHQHDPFDVAVVSGRRAHPVMSHVSDLPIVADICDADAHRLREGLRYRGIAAVSDAFDYTQARWVERALVAKAEELLFVSRRDRDLVTGGVRPDAWIVPLGVDATAWTRRTPALGSTIVFVGNMRYPPNDDAAVQLVEHILPRVRAAEPTARVVIVGRDPTPRVRSLGRLDGVEVTGYVDDVRPYLEQAAVTAVPLRFSSGVQSKVLQAMAMEVPVVVSPLAAAGLQVDGSAAPVTVAEDDASFADAIVARLRAAASHAAPDARAREFVLSHFDWLRSAALVESAAARAIAT